MPPLAGWHFSWAMNQIIPPKITTSIPIMIKAEARGLVAKTILDVLRSFSIVNFGSPNLGERIEENLIVAAIVVGQADGRLLCASDIAGYIGLPRATVIRKLRTVSMSRMLGKLKDGNRACYYIKEPNDEKAIVEIRKVMFAIRQCYERLSKMDTPKLDGKS